MNIKELAELLDTSENNIRNNFKRMSSRQLKKGNLITRTKENNEFQYFLKKVNPNDINEELLTQTLPDNIKSAKEINKQLNYTGNRAGDEDIILRCKNAGIIVKRAEQYETSAAHLFEIIKDNSVLPGEQWISSYLTDALEVSSEGRIRTTKTHKLLGSKNEYGYIALSTVLPETNTQKNLSAHRLVYFSFHPENIKDEKHLQIDHINGQRDDNRLINLRALTNVENVAARAQNQAIVKTLTTEIVSRIGYAETEKILKNILTNLEK